MTRTGDTFLPVMARPTFVAANHAQYFVSIHCDSRGARDSRSGLLIYYHGGNAIEREMASDVLMQTVRASRLPPYGVLSDKTRFPSGFGVLRGSAVPSLLVECGFLNDALDLKALHQERTQQNIADGIAAGLEQFNTEAPMRAKMAYVADVHAHNEQIVEFWSAVAVNSDVVFWLVKQHKPEKITNLLAPKYVFNGRTLTKQQVVQQLRSQIQKYGSHYEMTIVNVIPSASSNQMTLISTERWGSGNKGTESVTLSRRDVWTKTPGGWKLASTDVK
jgi:hypothetical protein